MKNTRYMYQLSAKGYGCFCVLTKDCEAIAAKLGRVSSFPASTIVNSDKCVEPSELETPDTRVERIDMRECRRNLLKSIVRDYGRDKATLHRLGLIPL